MALLKRLKGNKVISAVVKWQNTMWYPFTFALLGAAAALFGIYAYVPVFYLHMAGVVFAVLFNDDLKVYFTPLLLIFPSFGKDGLSDFTQGVNNGMPYIDPVGFAQIIVCAGIMIVAFIIKLIVTGAFADIFRRRSTFGFGLLVFAGVCLLNGVFSPSWSPIDLAFGALEAMSFTIFYFLFSVVAMRSEDVAAYVCKVMLILGFMIAAEVGGLSGMLAARGELFRDDGVFMRDNIVLGWGNSTIIACMTALTIPASMYVAHSRKKGTLAYLAAALFFILTVYLQSRNAALFGGIALVAGGVICCVSGKNKVANRYFTVVLVGLAIVALGFVSSIDGFWEKLFGSGFMHIGSGNNGRFDRWADGLNDFCRSPIFGVGYLDGSVPLDSPSCSPNFYYNMYHNIFIQLIGSMGIVGLIAFLVHFKKFVEVICDDFSCDKLLLCLMPIIMLLMSFLDIYFFLVNMQIYYGAFLTAIEKRNIELRAEIGSRFKTVPYGAKPKVAVLSVSANDTAERLRSAFGEDAAVYGIGIADGKLVRRVTKSIAATGLFGFLHALARFMLGDRLAAKLSVLASAKRERQVLSAGGYDAIIATDWASAQAAALLKGKDRPYIATLSDRFDGRMNADVGDAVIIGEKERAKAERVSGFACGNVRGAETFDEAAALLRSKIAALPRAEKSEQLE